MIEPVIPPQTSLEERLHGPLPSSVIPRTADPNIVYGIALITHAGRVTDHAVFSALGWRPGTRLTLSCQDERLILVCAAPDSSVRMNNGGFFRIPYRQRRRVGLLEGDRALVVAHREQKRLLIHPPAVLDGLMSQSRRILEGHL
ncbi:hypothetical protein [Nocardia ignorata]|uniref:AbrB/MazE/SpoVT family DNA-binding domain-containing protein n=1 Tax=Nocardia ignorata TaxID=145285 RepID=A0A4R6P1C8_NOCIG|nr:hypothetical protein [Nocardia ignorata]TDP27729.1 hypothetical protein DFR75_1221 [Nocardia ignorata]